MLHITGWIFTGLFPIWYWFKIRQLSRLYSKPVCSKYKQLCQSIVLIIEEQFKCKELLTFKFQPASEINPLGTQMYLHKCAQIIVIIMWTTFFCQLITDPFVIIPKHNTTVHLWGGWLLEFHFREQNRETTWSGTFQRPSLTLFTCLEIKSNLITSVPVLYQQIDVPFSYFCLALPFIPSPFLCSGITLLSVPTDRKPTFDRFFILLRKCEKKSQHLL